MKSPFGIHIEGSNNGDDLKHAEFMEAFIDFVESKGWSFGGGSTQIDEEGKKIPDID